MRQNILIIGYGSISRKHLKILLKIKKYEIYIISKHLKSCIGATIISEDQAKQKKFDFCFILTPATNRLKYLKIFKNNSKKFFLEKPISNNYNSTKKYFSILDKKIKKKLYVGYVFNHHSLINYLIKKINKIDKKNIKSIQIISKSNIKDWRKNITYYKSVSANQKFGGGVVNELSHELNFLVTLLKYQNIKKKYCNLHRSKNLMLDVEDRADLFFKYKNLFPINVTLDFNCIKKERRIIIETVAQTFDLNLNENSLYIYKGRSYRKIKLKNEFEKMFDRQLTYFLKQKFNSKDLINALDTVKIIHEIKK